MFLAKKFKAHAHAPAVLLSSFVGLGLVACRAPSSRLPIDQVVQPVDGASSSGEAAQTLEPLPVEGPVDLLPADVSALAEAIDPAAVLDLLTSLDNYREFNAARGALRAEIGVDLLDATQWQQVGLDSHGPAGIGLLDVEAQGFFVYVSVSDQAKCEEFIVKVSEAIHKRDELASADVGHGRVYRIGDELSVILREGVAVMVFVDRPERAVRDYAATVATIDPREALSHTEGFSWAREQIEDADDGLIFVSPNGLLDQIEREAGLRESNYGLTHAEDELDRARATGASAEEIRELERLVEEERRWEQEREAARVGRRELARGLLGPIAAFVAAADLRDGAIEAHGRALIPGEALLRELFVPTESESPLLSAIDEPPMTAVDGRVNMQALVGLVELFARAEGESLESINREVLAELGVDVLGDLIPALTGAGGLMLTEHGKPNPKRLSEVDKSLGLAAYAELSKPDAIREILDDLARAKRFGGVLTQARRGDGWVLQVPQWHDVDLALVGDRLVMSTDAKLASRIKDARPGSQAEALADPQHPLRGPSPTPSLRLYQRWIWLVYADAHEPWTQDAESMLYDMNTHDQLTFDEAAKVPRSRQFKRKFKELEKLVDELNSFQRRQAARDFERQLGVAESFGDMGFQVDRLSDGLGFHALWRMTPGSTPFELVFKLFASNRDGTDWSDHLRTQERAYEIVEELRQLRQADLDDAAAKQG
ncbi:hypothetical protein ENSA5_29150 [Enhygromyxa salina]|uniref:DUF3352 domain-containing protein n=1 Tax=Enhygromyxa salina TaxID=215803 RepID=A0A2S9Y1U8_9BACT|nr:hypothetical protein [Enhygromyxa salina]PRP99069.1 hypothetical protein ENSA5_29150 [Enhygromyxa salina]